MKNYEDMTDNEDLLKLATRISDFNLKQNIRYRTKFEVLIPSIMCRLIELKDLE